ncbi:MAG: hypothetical protein VW684_11420 [Betaproteobacteria bacterium]
MNDFREYYLAVTLVSAMPGESGKLIDLIIGIKHMNSLHLNANKRKNPTNRGAGAVQLGRIHLLLVALLAALLTGCQDVIGEQVMVRHTSCLQKG